MSKLYQTFQSPYSLCKPPQTISFHTTFLSEFVVKYPKTSSFFWIFWCRNSSLTKTTDSHFFLLKKYLVVVNLSNITLSLNHSIMYVCCWRRNQRARKTLEPSMETFLLLLTKSRNTRNFSFSLCSMSVSFFFCFRFLAYLDHYCIIAGFDSLKPLKSTNQVTLSNERMNHFFWA